MQTQSIWAEEAPAASDNEKQQRKLRINFNIKKRRRRPCPRSMYKCFTITTAGVCQIQPRLPTGLTINDLTLSLIPSSKGISKGFQNACFLNKFRGSFLHCKMSHRQAVSCSIKAAKRTWSWTWSNPQFQYRNCTKFIALWVKLKPFMGQTGWGYLLDQNTWLHLCWAR